MSFSFPRVYPILDSSILPASGRAEFLRRLGGELAQAGITLLEYRNKTGVPSDRSSSLGWKTGADAELLADAEILRATLPAGKVKLILDDRADLVERLGFDGAHVDAGDLKPAEARRLLGSDRIVGTFGGSEALVPGILAEPVDYLSIGPVYPTRTKQTSKHPIGLEGVRRLRAQAGPGPVLVAVGGITLDTAAAALAAGATVVAVSEALFHQPDPAAEFRRWMAELG
ncbi:MAG TPA: thiamine phosphate synthase [Terracidiphilus sp.]|nr:thiamine phosphate synthase [Terracidiphilus sp.]